LHRKDDQGKSDERAHTDHVDHIERDRSTQADSPHQMRRGVAGYGFRRLWAQRFQLWPLSLMVTGCSSWISVSPALFPILVAFTDGISEAMNRKDEEWGEAGILETVKASPSTQARDLRWSACRCC
jgi:hypothetical protein